MPAHHIRAPLAALAAATLVAACDPLPAAGPPDAGLAGAFEPNFSVVPPGALVPTSCLTGRASGYGRLPARCVLDSALAAQLADPRDAIRSRPPGPPSAIPAGRAADAYILGGEPEPPIPPAPITEPVVDTTVE